MAKAPKKVKLPKRMLTILNRLRAGQTLCVSFRKSEIGDDRIYWYEPSGIAAPRLTCEKAIERGLLVPNKDGLFGDSQTFRAA